MNLVGLKELSELLEIPYEKLKVWKSRGRLPEPFQVISGTPVWDWDESEEEFRSIEVNDNSGRPRKPKISIQQLLIQAAPANSNNKSDRNLSIKVLGKKVIDINTDNFDINDKNNDGENEEDSNNGESQIRSGKNYWEYHNSTTAWFSSYCQHIHT